MKNTKHIITVSNAVFLSRHYKIRNKYREAVASTYKSKLLEMDFQNRPDACTILINKYIYYCEIMIKNFNYFLFKGG